MAEPKLEASSREKVGSDSQFCTWQSILDFKGHCIKSASFWIYRRLFKAFLGQHDKKELNYSSAEVKKLRSQHSPAVKIFSLHNQLKQKNILSNIVSYTLNFAKPQYWTFGFLSKSKIEINK